MNTPEEGQIVYIKVYEEIKEGHYTIAYAPQALNAFIGWQPAFIKDIRRDKNNIILTYDLIFVGSDQSYSIAPQFVFTDLPEKWRNVIAEEWHD